MIQFLLDELCSPGLTWQTYSTYLYLTSTAEQFHESETWAWPQLHRCDALARPDPASQTLYKPGLPLSARPQSTNLCLPFIPPASLARPLHIPTPSQADTSLPEQCWSPCLCQTPARQCFPRRPQAPPGPAVHQQSYADILTRAHSGSMGPCPSAAPGPLPDGSSSTSTCLTCTPP